MKGEPEYIVLTLTREEAELVHEAVEQHMCSVARIRPWATMSTATKLYMLKDLMKTIESSVI